MNSCWKIEFLGGLAALSHSERITRFATQKTAHLLAYLAYHCHQSHPREVLVELLWPECPSAHTGLTRLSTLLSFLRHHLEPPGTTAGAVVQADRTHIRLNHETITTDVAAFERLLDEAKTNAEGTAHLSCLQQAIALYRGELLPGWYDEWVVREQTRLNERYLGALHDLAWSLEQKGALEAALEAIEKVVAADPYRESAYRLEMRLHMALGHPIAAQQAYRSLERRLKTDLAMAPSETTRELAERIRRDPVAVACIRETVSAPRAAAISDSTASRSTCDSAVQAASLTTSHQKSDPRLTQHLPMPLTRFFGREHQMERLKEWLTDSDTRLISVIGPGGVGKTRLATEAARLVAPAFGGRIWFVDLTAIRHSHLLPYTLAHTLNMTPDAQADPLEQIVNRLTEGTSLLFLDNFEHLLCDEFAASKSDRPFNTGSAWLVRSLLERAPALKCLVTSRQPLQIEGEQELTVPTLELPQEEDEIETLARRASVALYMDRARAVRPDFALTRHNALSLCALCRRLEGLPLALEMAGGLTKTLPPARMLERLERQLSMLKSHRRDVLPRQQSLYATLEWSYDLLEPELRRCFRQLAVFRGGFSDDALEAVCSLDPGVAARRYSNPSDAHMQSEQPECRMPHMLPDLVNALVTRSLAVCEEHGDAIRYRMLESVREFAAEKLEASGERTDVQRRHAAYFLALAETAESKLSGQEQILWLERLDTERANLHAALEWVEAKENENIKANGAESALRMAASLCPYWISRGYLNEGRAHLEEILRREDARGNTPVRARALNGAGSLAWRQGDNRAARAYYEESLAIMRELGDRRGSAASLNHLGIVAYLEGDYTGCTTYYEASLTIMRELGDRGGISNSLGNLALAANARGDFAAAMRHYEEGLPIWRELGDKRRIACALSVMGSVALNQGDYEMGRARFEEGLAIRRELGDRPGIAVSLNDLGFAAERQGDFATAKARYDESLILFRELGDRRAIGSSLHNQGSLALRQGGCNAAGALFKESLAIRRKSGDRQGIVESLEGFVHLAAVENRSERVIRLSAAAHELRKTSGAPLPDHERQRYDRNLAAARETLGEEAFMAAWSAGRTMTMDQAVELALLSTTDG
jgi:predicted ATPase/DNA-binding SARP family transcriptional activator